MQSNAVQSDAAPSNAMLLPAKFQYETRSYIVYCDDVLSCVTLPPTLEVMSSLCTCCVGMLQDVAVDCSTAMPPSCDSIKRQGSCAVNAMSCSSAQWIVKPCNAVRRQRNAAQRNKSATHRCVPHRTTVRRNAPHNAAQCNATQ